MVYQKPSIFRKKAANYFQSPEELNHVVKLNSPKTGLVAAGVGILLVGIMAWASFGSVKLTLPGQGVLLTSDFQTLTAGTSGTIEELTIQPGAMVEAGQVIAQLNAPELLAKWNKLESLKNELVRSKDQLQLDVAKEKAEKKDQLIASRQLAQKELLTIIKKKNFLNFRQKDSRYMLDQGIISEAEYQTLATEFSELIQKERDIQVRIESLEEQLSQLKYIQNDQLARLESRVDRIKTTQIDFEYDYRKRTQVIAAQEGTVIDVFLHQGDAVEKGQSMAVINPSSDGKAYQLIAYVPNDRAAALEKGMEVEIKPKNGRMGELLVGIVETVSPYPVSKETINRHFYNAGQSESIHKLGVVNEVVVRLVPRLDADLAVAQPQLENGMLCDARFILKKTPPIFLVAPFLKGKWDG